MMKTSDMIAPISVIMVSYNSGNIIASALQCVYNHPAVHECIVVDNASQDDTVRIVQSSFPKTRIICNNDNLGFGRACNLALGSIHTEVALLMNPDAIIDSAGIKQLYEYFSLYPQAAAIAPVLNGNAAQGASTNQAVEVKYISGALVMLRMRHMQKIGFFDPAFFLFYEDNDICLRIIKAGYQLLLVSGIKAFHIPGKSCSLTAELNSLKLRSSTWSHLYFLRKHYGKIAAWMHMLLLLYQTGIKTSVHHFSYRQIRKLRASLAALEIKRNDEQRMLAESLTASLEKYHEQEATLTRSRDKKHIMTEHELTFLWDITKQKHEAAVNQAREESEKNWMSLISQHPEDISGKAIEHERKWCAIANALQARWGGETVKYEENRMARLKLLDMEWNMTAKELEQRWKNLFKTHEKRMASNAERYDRERRSLLDAIDKLIAAERIYQTNRDRLSATLAFLRNPRIFSKDA